MTQEQKQLLLIDLCARSSYGLKATTKSGGWPDVYNVEGYKNDKIYLDCPVYDEGDDEWLVESVIPYLRPMSSMTEEEVKEFAALESIDVIGGDTKITCVELSIDAIDWLNKKMFDYRGLISKGLALEAHKGMYN